MTDADRARLLLAEEGRTCVVCKGRVAHLSGLPGILPMLRLIDSGADVRGFSAADRVVGKAAAMLFVLAGVTEVYAPVMSESGRDLLTRHGVRVSCDVLVSGIRNRDDTGPCPIEESVRDISDPEEAPRAIKRALDETFKVRGAV